MPTLRRNVSAEVVRDLRGAVLRPGLPAEQSVFPGDEGPEATHVAVVEDGEGPVLAVGSLLPEDPPGWMAATTAVAVPAAASGERWWRVRGMATVEGRRGEGLGAQVLDALLEAAAGRGGVVWCNARLPAVPFYRRAGFAPVGEVFEEPRIGPHQAMVRRASPA